MRYEQYAQDANKFLADVAVEMGNPSDQEHAYRVTVAVIHAIRDILTPEESLHLVSQLPMYLKAEYVNGWKLPAKERIRSMEEFLQRVRTNNKRTADRDFGNDAQAKERIRAVLNVLQKHITVGEIQDVLDQFPTELVELWGNTRVPAP